MGRYLLKDLMQFRFCVTNSQVINYSRLPLPDVYQVLENLREEKLIIKARKEDRQVILPSSKINMLTLNELLRIIDLPDKFTQSLNVVNNGKQETQILDFWYQNQQAGKRTLSEIFVANGELGSDALEPSQLVKSHED